MAAIDYAQVPPIGQVVIRGVTFVWRPYRVSELVDCLAVYRSEADPGDMGGVLVAIFCGARRVEYCQSFLAGEPT